MTLHPSSLINAALAQYLHPFSCLVYHRLHDAGAVLPPHLRAFSVTIDEFAQQLDALQKAGYTAVPVTDLLAWQAGTQQPPERPILITFDDGWASNATLAWPELKQRGMTCTIFTVADRQSPIFAEGGDIDRAMTEEELALLAQEGASIQSHGFSHRPFTEIPKDDLLKDLCESREKLEKITSKPVQWLASPYGLSNRRVAQAVYKAGYRGYADGILGMTTLGKPGKLIILRRLGVRPGDTPEKLLAMITAPPINSTIIKANLKRSLRLLLGYRLSDQLRKIKSGT